MSEEKDTRGGLSSSQKTIAGILLSNVGTLFVAWLTFAGVASTAQSDTLRTAFTQIQAQSKEILSLRELLLSNQIKIIELQVLLSDTVSKEQLLANFLDYLPFPAWIKVYDTNTGTFVMKDINSEYTSKFGITPNQYIGKTDFDIHPYELASDYYENDKLVQSSINPLIVKERVRISNGSIIFLIVYKFNIILPNGDTAIGGVAIQQRDLDALEDLVH